MNGRGRGIDVKVEGRADLSKLIQEFERAKAKAEGLGKQIGEVEGNLSRLDRFKMQLGEALGGLGRQGLGQLGGWLGGAFGAGAMFNQVRGGLERYKDQLIQLDNESRTVKRLGQDYRELQNQINAVGRAYGFQTREVTALHSALGQTYGRAGAGRVLAEMQLIQGFSRGYGMSAMEGGSIFTRAAQMGMTTEGGDTTPRQFAALIADAVVAGGMQGREGEVVDAIQGLGQQINSRIIGFQGTQLSAEALATLNQTGIRGLQGQAGAQLLGQLNQAIMSPGGGEAGNLFMYQALTGGRGGLNVADYEYLREEGLAGQGPTGKSNLQAVMEAVNKMPVSGRYRLMAARELTGLSMHQYEALEQAFFKDGSFDMEKLGGLQSRLGTEGLNNVDASVWGLLAEVQRGGDLGAVGREFEQLSGQKADTSSADALFNQIAQYGRGNVALSEGQEREKLDADIAKAAELAGSKLYELEKAAQQAALALMQITGGMPGPLGGVAPMIAGAAAGQLGGAAMGQAAKWAGSGLGRIFGLGGAAAGGAGAAGAAGGAGAAGAAGGAGLAAAGGVVAAGLGGALAGSAFAENVLGVAGLGSERQVGAMQAGAGRVGALLGGQGDAGFWGDLGRAAGGIGASLWAVPLGLGGGIAAAARGGDFREGYFRTFDMVNPFADFSRQPGGMQIDPRQLDAALVGTALEGKGPQIAAYAAQTGIDPATALAMLTVRTQGMAPNAPEIDGMIAGFFGGLQQPRQQNLLLSGEVGQLLSQAAPQGMAGQWMQQTGQAQQQYSATIPSSRGGWWDVPEDEQPALLHRREMVLPAPIADLMRSMLQMAQRPAMPEPIARSYGGQVAPGGLLAPGQMREASMEIRLRIEPIEVKLPDGTTQQIRADASTDSPFAGIIDQPINTTGTGT